MNSWYDEAEAYDLAFSFSPEREIEFLDAVFRASCGRRPVRVLEPMVGVARLVPPLESRGCRVTGFDRSAAMLRRAQFRAPKAMLFRADARRFQLAPVFEAAHCLIDSFRYLLLEHEARAFLDNVAGTLVRGAPFVLGLELASDGPNVPEEWSVEGSGQIARVRLRSGESAGPGLEWMDVEIELSGDQGVRTVRSRLPQRIWSPRAFLRFIDALSDFEVGGIYRRDHDWTRPLSALPPRGGPIIIVLTRT